MTEIPENQPPTVPAAFKDRRVGLILMGILQMFCGGFFLLMGLLVSLVLVLPAPAGTTPPKMSDIAAALAIFAGTAIFFIWTGIGAMLARRWARALMLMTSWIWLIGGIITVISMGFVLPQIFASLPQQGGTSLPDDLKTTMIISIMAFYTVIFVLVPLIFLLFYRSQHVKATCEFRNPQPCWTDRCPLPVLAMSLAAWMIAPLLCLSILKGSPFPFFGMMLSGAAGNVLLLVVAVVWGYAAWGCYRLKMSSWWLLQILMVFHCVSVGITIQVLGVGKFYQALGMPPEQVDMLMSGPFASVAVFMLMNFLTWATWLWYLVWIRHHFIETPAGRLPERGHL
jgi:hypothetical protein